MRSASYLLVYTELDFLVINVRTIPERTLLKKVRSVDDNPVMKPSDEQTGKELNQNPGRFPRIEAAITLLQTDDFLFSLLLLLLVALNIADFSFTSKVLLSGYREGNPLMNYLFKSDPAVAGLVKLGIVAVFSLIAWSLRWHRKIVITSIFAVEIYFILLVYHMVGAWLMIGE